MCIEISPSGHFGIGCSQAAYSVSCVTPFLSWFNAKMLNDIFTDCYFLYYVIFFLYRCLLSFLLTYQVGIFTVFLKSFILVKFVFLFFFKDMVSKMFLTFCTGTLPNCHQNLALWKVVKNILCLLEVDCWCVFFQNHCWSSLFLI